MVSDDNYDDNYDDDGDDNKPQEDFCITEDGVVKSFIAWDLSFSSQEALQKDISGFFISMINIGSISKRNVIVVVMIGLSWDQSKKFFKDQTNLI